MKKESCKILLVVTLFAIAMGFLESCVVIYLRKIYYPNGFNFPLKGFVDPEILNIEWIREFFTIVMLACVGYLAAKKFYPRLAYFLIGFAVWDISYYIWLKAFLNWPASLLTWDLLFLIPFPWIGPVLCPVIISLTMILLGIVIINYFDKGKNVSFNKWEWYFFIVGSIVILYTFLIDYGRMISEGGFIRDFFVLINNSQFINQVSTYIPNYYNWAGFIVGEAIILVGIAVLYFRVKK